MVAAHRDAASRDRSLSGAQSWELGARTNPVRWIRAPVRGELCPVRGRRNMLREQRVGKWEDPK